MSSDASVDQLTVDMGRDTVSVSAVVDASPAEVFDFVRRPANHPEISGDGSVRANTFGPDELGEGDKFGMNMKLLGIPYRISSVVKEFDQDRLIAWAHMGGHRWRWSIEPHGDSQAKVTETYDGSTAKAPPMLRLLGYPKRHEANVKQSVANVVAHFADQS